MGVLYAAGRGVEESDSEAIRWFNAAAKSGHSQGNLGVKQIHTSSKPMVGVTDFKSAQILNDCF